MTREVRETAEASQEPARGAEAKATGDASDEDRGSQRPSSDNDGRNEQKPNEQGHNSIIPPVG